MTALPPAEGVQVRGVLTSKYPTNTICAHPDCDKPVEGVHHIFPRGTIGNGSYFVEVIPAGAKFKDTRNGGKTAVSQKAIPHAVGLCGSGTTGHHGDVEEHRAWIKYEDGEFVWYSRDLLEYADEDWHKVGALNPQPGAKEGKPKKKRFKGEQRRKRRVITVRVPDDEAENGGALWDEVIDIGRELLVKAGLYENEDIPVYQTIMAVAYRGLETLREETRGS